MMTRKQVSIPKGIAQLSQMFCGCSNPGSTWEPIYKELCRLRDEQYDANAGLAAAICDYFELSEHGTAIRGAWLTEEGKSALAFLEQHGLEWKDSEEYDFVDDEGVYH